MILRLMLGDRIKELIIPSSRKEAPAHVDGDDPVVTEVLVHDFSH